MAGTEKTAASSTGALERAAYWLLVALTFFLPALFLPTPLFSVAFVKVSLFLAIALVVLVLVLITQLRQGVLTIPMTSTLGALLLLPVSYGVATLFSSSLRESFIGQGTEVDTLAVILAGVVIALLIPLVVRTRRRIAGLFAALGGSFIFVVLFHVIRFIGGASLFSFGLFPSISSSPVGSWSAMGGFAGLLVVLSLVFLERATVSRLLKWVLWGVLLAGLVFLALVNAFGIWVAVGALAFIFFVYQLSSRRAKGHSGFRFSLLPLGVVLVSLIFLLSGNILGSSLTDVVGIQFVDVRPSVETTLEVAGEGLKENPLFGVGPNQFNALWLLNKPVGVNETAFWNIDFSSGSGFVPTALASVGSVGFLAWIAFLALFLWLGIKTLFVASTSKGGQELKLASFFGAVFLWTFAVIHNPPIALFGLAFVFTGLFFATLITEGLLSTRTITFTEQPRLNFVTVLSSVLLIILSLVAAYGVGTHFVAGAFFGNGVRILDRGGDLDAVERSFARAATLAKNDAFYRALVESRRIRLQSILSQRGLSQEVVRSQFQNVFGAAVADAQRAIDLDRSDYRNWLVLGQVYESVVSIDGAYEQASVAYGAALERNPHDPSLFLVQARLEALAGNSDDAREWIRGALTEKSNYTEAIFLLSQIEINEGDVQQALQSVEAATLLAPNDPVAFFQLGFLRYSTDDFHGAISALEQAVILNPFYANARYFLGLSYEELGNADGAIEQFEAIVRTNADNQEVQFILANLRAGRAPFANAEPPIDETPPEDREELPLDE